jgi:adenylate cyclase class 2
MSNIEHEGKVLNINIDDVRKKLELLGASKVADYNFKRYVFDCIPKMEQRWVRLRSNGTNTTLAVKEIHSNSIDGTEEWETDVADLETTLIILEKIGIKPRGYQENTREEYSLDGATVSIDCWPRLNPYLEIEANSTEHVLTIATRLGFDNSDVVGTDTEKMYKAISVDLKQLAVLKFDEEQ